MADLRITLDLNHGSNKVSTYIQATTKAARENPLPLLEKAIEALIWQRDNYRKCPYHND